MSCKQNQICLICEWIIQINSVNRMNGSIEKFRLKSTFSDIVNSFIIIDERFKEILYTKLYGFRLSTIWFMVICTLFDVRKLRFLFIVTELGKRRTRRRTRIFSRIFHFELHRSRHIKWVSKHMKVTKYWLNFDSERTIALNFPKINQSKDIIMTAALVMNQRVTM